MITIIIKIIPFNQEDIVVAIGIIINPISLKKITLIKILTATDNTEILNGVLVSFLANKKLENIFINEYNFKDGNHILKINDGFIHSFFVIEGNLINQKNKLEKGTFFSVDNEDELIFTSSGNAKIFEIISPINPSYQTYSQLR